MNHSENYEVVSIDSLRTRYEIIQQSKTIYDLNESAPRKEKQFPTKEQIQFINANKNELPEHELAVVHLHFWEGMTISEISEFIKLPYSLVKNLLNEAIHRLRLNYLIEFSMSTTKPQKLKGVLELVS
jgi:RNA polymerase sigma factor (sigma-70 family)